MSISIYDIENYQWTHRSYIHVHIFQVDRTGVTLRVLLYLSLCPCRNSEVMLEYLVKHNLLKHELY